MKINPCPVCKSKVEVDKSGVYEGFGKQFQNLYLSCTNEDCWAGLWISVDFNDIHTNDDDIINDMIVLWNKINANRY